jgi:hypothetical protein
MVKVLAKLFSLLVCWVLFTSICFSAEVSSAPNAKNGEIENFVKSYTLVLKEKNYEKLLGLFDNSNPEFKKQETDKWKALFKKVDLNTLKVESFLIESNENEAEIILAHKTEVPLNNLLISTYINEVYKIAEIKDKWYLADYVAFGKLYDTIQRNLRVRLLPETNKLRVSAELLLKKGPQNQEKYIFKLDEDFQVEKISSGGHNVEFKKLGYVLFLRKNNNSKDKNTEFRIDYSGKVIEKNNQYVKKEFSIIREENFWYPKRDSKDFARGTLEITVPRGVQTVADTGTLSKTISDNKTETFIWETKEPSNSFGFLASKKWEINQVEVKNQKIFLYLMKDTKLDKRKLVKKAEEILIFYNDIFGQTRKRRLAFVEGPFSYNRPNYIPFDENIMAHEISHNWWLGAFSSDSATNLWLCEGFATYSDELYNEMKYGRNALEEMILYNLIGYLSAIKGQEDQPLADILYGSIIYNKGAYVLHNLRYVVTDEIFFKILKHYTKKYFNQDVNYRSFQSAAEEIYGKQLDWFFNQWLTKPGIAEFELKFHIQPQSNKESIVEVEILQRRDLFTMPIDVKFLSNGKITHKRFWITDKEKTKSFIEKLDFIPDKVCFDSEIAIPTIGIFEFAEALNQGVELSYVQKKYSEAIEKFKHALQIRPDDLVVRRELTKAYLENDDYSNFEKEANYLINRKYEEYEYDQRRWMYLFYGNYYDLKNMREKAIEMYKKVIEIRKGDEYPQNMAKIYMNTPYKKESKK